ncbi:MAG: Maf family protein [Halanaerobiales bacterium]
MAGKMVLASASPRRKELLERLGLNFTTVPAGIEEEKFFDYRPEEMVKELARAKAEKISGLVEETIIIAADTVVVYEERVLGKPGDRQEAREMLKQIQGDRHTVMTGLAVLSTDREEVYSICDSTEVYMKKVDVEEIEAYVNTGEPMDKAGSYGIQGLGGIFVDKIIGSYFTVMGLPVHRLDDLLKKFSVNVLNRN